jgi:septum formation protein
MFHVTHSLILASASPRRQQFLRDLGLDFTVVKPKADEPRPLPGEEPAAYVGRVAALKAGEVASAHPDQVIVAADTAVVIDGDILGKPRDEADSLRMLERLAGRTHAVITAVHVIFPDAAGFNPARTQGDPGSAAPRLEADALRSGFACESRVRFHAWPRAILAAYARSGESLDKAGAYAVQGKGAFLVAAITGSWSNVVGLPVAELIEFLLQRGLIGAD